MHEKEENSPSNLETSKRHMQLVTMQKQSPSPVRIKKITDNEQQ